mmetsp:Transcript_28591/g.48643  ORF Transcript_28591/g.48643 Transcript_28591/m.48643 type:complete len:236 (-) Transcript_28591:18-725(-)
MEVRVVAVEVVADVRGLAGPGLERLQLMLGLAHVRVEVATAAHGPHAVARIDVNRIEALVYLHHHEHAFLTSSLGQFAVLLQRLHWRFGHQHVQASANGSQRDRKVGVIRGKDDDGISTFELVHGLDVCLRVHLVICRVRLTVGVEPGINVRDVPLHVGTDARELFAVDASHCEPIGLPTAAQVKHHQPHDACALVTVCCLTTDVASGVLSGTDHEDINHRDREQKEEENSSEKK